MIRTIRGALVAALTCLSTLVTLSTLAVLPGTAAAAGLERQTFSVVGTYGKPASVTLVEPPTDDARRRALLEDVVLRKYAARCGAACTDQWNATIGAALSLTAAE